MHPEFTRGEAPPAWFWDFYDAISQGLPVGPWPSIKKQPIYIRFRHRLVSESMKSARYETARKAKAMGVIDLSNL